MQLPNLRDWKRQGYEVHKDRMRGMSEGKRIVVDALPGVRSVPLLPRKADRRADKGGCETKSDHRCNLQVNNGPNDLPEAPCRENLEVEKQE